MWKWTSKLKTLFSASSEEAFPIEELEQTLYESDIPGSIVQTLIKKTRGVLSLGKPAVLNRLVEETTTILDRVKAPQVHLPDPSCILLVGVNGSGKTTTAARLAKYYRGLGRKVLLGAADTFRAGATEQLKLWGEKLGIPVVFKASGSDPASVVYEAWQRAKTENALLIVDTAGRIHTHVPLMEELGKIFRTLQKSGDGAPHEVWLVLDGTNGQNSIEQAKQYTKSIPVTGLVVTKLDGTAKGGGAIFSSVELEKPIRFIGVGEKEDDVRPFEPKSFVKDFYGI